MGIKTYEHSYQVIFLSPQGRRVTTEYSNDRPDPEWLKDFAQTWLHMSSGRILVLKREVIGEIVF